MKKPVHLLFVVAMLFLFGMTTTANACEEDCPPCKSWNGSACEWDCGPEYCCGSPNACRQCCSSSQCYGCRSCSNYQCVDDDGNCTGCESCVNGYCVDDDSKCTGECHDCLDGNCYDDNSKCPTGQVCENGNCIEKCYHYHLNKIYEGSCVCGADGITDTCKSNVADLREVGIGKILKYERICVDAPTGVSGWRECDPKGTTGKIIDIWQCVDNTNMMGVLACFAINSLVCTVQCSAAAAACALNPASQECGEGLLACYGCLTDEGIDCGCMIIECDYYYFGFLFGDTLLLSGETCIGQ